MFDWLILSFILFIIYIIMKKPKSTTEKPAPVAKPEETPVVTAAPKAKAKAEKPVATVETESTPKKASPAKAPAKKAKAETAKPVVVEVAPEISVADRIGLTAGSIWNYVSENGATPVSKLVRELSEEEKIIQRSIGWLAQEGKITLEIVDRAETVALK
jgi:outer membrane biosynthesis protein TonB